MYLKLALRNIRRSVRDYAVYFITLLFGVAVFYAFNSIGSQQILFDMETSASRSVFDSTTYILGMFSVVVACVLGFLILYANQFLIRRRKREFGTYLVLGMTPGHVSRIVLYETVLVGMLSLAVGLICGVLLSQGLSFFTAALFGTTMTNYQFVFSPDAFLVTLACFAADEAHGQGEQSHEHRLVQHDARHVSRRHAQHEVGAELPLAPADEELVRVQNEEAQHAGHHH